MSNEVSGSHRKDVYAFSRLNGVNYHVWRCRMHDLLVMERLWPYVCGELPQPTENSERRNASEPRRSRDNVDLYDDDISDDGDDSHSSSDESSATARARRLLNKDLLLKRQAKWNWKSEIAKSRIRSGVEDDILVSIEKETFTAKELWEYLAKTYGKITAASLFNLKSKLCNKRMEPTDNLRNHLNSLRASRLELIGAGSDVSDEDFSFIILNSLPKSYVRTIEAIISQQEGKTLDSNNIINVLLTKFDQEDMSTGRTAETAARAVHKNRHGNPGNTPKEQSRNSEKGNDKGRKHGRPSRSEQSRNREKENEKGRKSGRPSRSEIRNSVRKNRK